MTRDKTYNFSAGPSVLPDEVLCTAASEMLDYRSCGMSVMEMSHRSSQYQEIFNDTKAKFRALMNVPDTHELLFLQGGASLQFSMVPMNLMGENGSADYAVTGNFASIAAKEAKKYGRVNIAADTTGCGHTRIPAQSELKLDKNAKYFYYCANNTIFGTEWAYTPDTGDVPIVCDMSSDILTKPVDISKYGIIFAGAQKNMAPAGLTVVIIDRSLAGHELPYTPLMMGYKLMIDKDSMYNTPPCYNIYMLGLMLDWVKEHGGVAGMEKAKKERAGALYDYLDSSRLFKACAQPGSRSDMNVTFRTGDAGLDAQFVKEAGARGILNVKGHRIAGGMRASIYNAQSMEAVLALRDFMREFEVEHSV